MISIAIQVLWLLIGIVVLCGVAWLALYVIKTVVGIAVPDRLEQGIWLIILLLIIIAILTIIAGGTVGGMGLHLR